MLTKKIISFDARRNLIVPGNKEETIRFAAEHWLHSAQRAVQQKGRFAVALSGGSTPKEIYQTIYQLFCAGEIGAWDKMFLFWSDERGVPVNHPESNYSMAMNNGIKNLPIPSEQIFRMIVEESPEQNAKTYEKIILKTIGTSFFDLVMLGLGEDGHTASLFPNSPALAEEHALAFSFWRSTKEDWRMTLTFPCINQSNEAVIYATGNLKASIVNTVLNAAIVSPYPASKIGTIEHKALWILDREAASLLKM